MKSSDSIAQLAGALAKAQGKFKPASKDSVNPHFKNRYADLAAIWDSIREPLSANSLAVVQGAESSLKEVVVTTTLAHESGEWVQTAIAIPLGKADAQGIGSAITYGRRYGLTALVGITQDDDDGETAVGRGRFVSTNMPRQTSGGDGGGRVAANDAPKTVPLVDPGPGDQVKQTAGGGAGQGGVLTFDSVLESLQGAGNIEALKAWWADAQQFSSHAQFLDLVKAKDAAKARFSTNPPAKVVTLVNKRRKDPLTGLAVQPLEDDEIPFDA
jgi:hypothetical protein